MEAKGDSAAFLLAAGVFVIALAANLFVCFGGGESARALSPSAEAVVRMMIADELSGEDSRGYHALIDSSMTTPLPTLAAAPFLFVDRAWDIGAGFYLLLSLMAAWGAERLTALARALDLRWWWLWGVVPVVALFLNPWTPLAAWRGVGATGSMALATAIVASLVNWMRRDSLLSLGLAANLLGLAIVWDTRFALLILPLLAIVAGRAGGAVIVGDVVGEIGEGPTKRRITIRAFCPDPRPGRVGALSLVFITPVIYIPLIWALFNWLIFEDAWRFMRDAAPLIQPWLAPLAVGVVVFCVGAFASIRRAPHSVAVVGLLYAIIVCGVGARAMTPSSTQKRALVGENVTRADIDDARELARYLRESKGGRLILVVGRPGYLIRELVGNEVMIIHRLDFDPTRILNDTLGRRVHAVLTEAQVALWRARLEQGHPGAWDWHFLDDHRIGRWRVLTLLRRPGDEEATQ